jgi:O-antigen/teichoic acid export membrane protein
MTLATVALRKGRSSAPSVRGAALGGAWMLPAAMIVSGVLTYAFHIVAARTLGPAAYGQIAVLWGAMFLIAIVLFRPVEQTTSRAVADRLARGEEVRSVLRAVGSLSAMLVGVAAVLAILGWSTLTERLFDGDNAMTTMLVAGVVAYGMSYLVRGVLGGTRWFAGYSLGLVVDSVARLAVAAPLLLVASKLTAATAVVAAGVAGALVPLLVGRRHLRGLRDPGAGSPFKLSSALSFAGPAGVVAGADQLFVNGGPLLVVVAGGPGATRAAGIVFAATMLVRAPVYVFQGLAAALLPNLTHLQATADAALFRRAVLRTVGFLLGCGALIAAGMALAGPAAMSTLYGADFGAARIDLVILGLGVGFYLAASTISQALLAVDRASAAAKAWAVSAAAFVALYFAIPGGSLMRVSGAFTCATLLCLTLLGVALSGRMRS